MEIGTGGDDKQVIYFILPYLVLLVSRAHWFVIIK